MGNRVKGRTKQKSVKAASHSGMGSKRKLSRMGKKQKKDRSGLDATFVGRAACLKKLQLSLKDFRRLCILKGVYPREPRGRAPGNKKGQVYYHIKDIRAIAHEPILYKFREFRAFMKKVRKAAGRNSKDEAARRHALAPTYTLHHLVKERYPRFVDAVSDLDDALTLVHLFSSLPSTGRIKMKVTHKAKTLAAAWGAYCSVTSSITKSFISVKGVYLEASIKGALVRWVVPHSFTQNLPKDVDYRVMLTFFEFYETLLSFVLFKLYNDIGVRYPLKVGNADDALGSTHAYLASNLQTLTSALHSSSGAVCQVVRDSVKVQTASKVNETDDSEKSKDGQSNKKNRELIKSVGAALHKLADEESDVDEDDVDDKNLDVAAPLKAALETMAEEEERTSGFALVGSKLDDDATKRRRLFAGLNFFLAREVPRGYLELACLAYGGRVGWEGPESPFDSSDPHITHHVVDRPKLPASYDNLPSSREYIQPQWILDCANFMFLLPIEKYGVGARLPPHLSPWVDNEEEGYKPAYAEEVERLKNGEKGETEVTQSTHLSSSEEREEAENEEVMSEKNYSGDSSVASSAEEELEEIESDEELDQEEDKNDEEDTEARNLAKGMMSKKASRLYGRMQHGIAQKHAKIEKLQRRRQEIESSKGKNKDGKTITKQKVERLKKERKTLENDYTNTGGSRKKRKKQKTR